MSGNIHSNHSGASLLGTTGDFQVNHRFLFLLCFFVLTTRETSCGQMSKDLPFADFIDTRLLRQQEFLSTVRLSKNGNRLSQESGRKLNLSNDQCCGVRY